MQESSLEVPKVSRQFGRKCTAVIVLFPATNENTSEFLSLISHILAERSLDPERKILLSISLTSIQATSLVWPLSIAMCL